MTQDGVAAVRLRQSPPLAPLLCGFPLALSAQGPGTFPNRADGKPQTPIVAILQVTQASGVSGANGDDASTSGEQSKSKRAGITKLTFARLLQHTETKQEETNKNEGSVAGLAALEHLLRLVQHNHGQSAKA